MGCFTAANVAYGQQDVVRIAAIVNDEIISGFDLENRVRLVATSTNSSKSPAALRRLAPQVLRQMIDERIQLHEAKKLNALTLYPSLLISRTTSVAALSL